MALANMISLIRANTKRGVYFRDWKNENMTDMQTKQYWVKIQYAGQTLEVQEIWADSENAAHLKAINIAQSKMEFQSETAEETELRLLSEKLRKLEKRKHSLSEFIWDDYGDTVDQLGIEKVQELEAEYSGLCKEISNLREQGLSLELKQVGL